MPNIILKRSDKSLRLIHSTPQITLKQAVQRVVIKRSAFGPAGKDGIDGDDSDKHFSLPFTNSSNVTVTHNLNKRPAVTVIDSAGDEVFGTVNHLTTNVLTVSFSSSFSGTVFCN